MKFRPITVDETLQELTEHGTEEFSMSMDEQLVSDEQCGHVMHWHYEVQIVLVTRGSVLFRTPAGEFYLNAGEGIFLNSTCLHEAIPTEDKNSLYICVNFHPRIVFGHSGSLLRRDYVDPILHSAKMQAIPFYQEPWHRSMCSLLQELTQVSNAQEYGYELMLQIIIQRMWMLLLTNNRYLIEDSAKLTFTDKQRMKALQQFIHKNYMDRISLAEIAADNAFRLFDQLPDLVKSQTAFHHQPQHRTGSAAYRIWEQQLLLPMLQAGDGLYSHGIPKAAAAYRDARDAE